MIALRAMASETTLGRLIAARRDWVTVISRRTRYDGRGPPAEGEPLWRAKLGREPSARRSLPIPAPPEPCPLRAAAATMPSRRLAAQQEPEQGRPSIPTARP
jgi:hypothetical protein